MFEVVVGICIIVSDAHMCNCNQYLVISSAVHPIPVAKIRL